MGSLFYIILKSAKNSLKELLRKPGKLVMYLLVLLAMVGVIVASIFTKAAGKQVAPMFLFKGVFFAFIAMFFVATIRNGLSRGDTIFEMNDVNLLFVSPINPRKILLYGLLRLMKTCFFAGFFILFQANTLALFGIDYGGVLLAFGGYMLAMMVLSIGSLVIYNVTHGNPARKRAVKIAACLLFVPAVIYLIVKMLGAADLLAALEAVIASPFLSYIPIVGWTASGVSLLLTGELAAGLLYFAADALLGVSLVTYLMLSKTDYYEDTLVATETAFEKKRAMAEGNMNGTATSNKKVKVAKTGISGAGASAIFRKHIRESFRENRFGFLTVASVLMIAGSLVMAYFVKDLTVVLQILMWMQVFLISMGRGMKETYSHYIYMIPESSFKKMLWSNMEVFIKTLVESVLIFGLGALIAGSSVFVGIGCAAVFTLFSVMLLGINYLSMRITGADISMGMLLMIYMIAVLVIIAPGLAAALIVGFGIGGTAGTVVGLFILAAWELVAGLACFALSKGALDWCDMVAPRK